MSEYFNCMGKSHKYFTLKHMSTCNLDSPCSCDNLWTAAVVIINCNIYNHSICGNIEPKYLIRFANLDMIMVSILKSYNITCMLMFLIIILYGVKRIDANVVQLVNCIGMSGLISRNLLMIFTRNHMEDGRSLSQRSGFLINSSMVLL